MLGSPFADRRRRPPDHSPSPPPPGREEHRSPSEKDFSPRNWNERPFDRPAIQALGPPSSDPPRRFEVTTRTTTVFPTCCSSRPSVRVPFLFFSRLRKYGIIPAVLVLVVAEARREERTGREKSREKGERVEATPRGDLRLERERVIGESASSWINSLRFVNYYRPVRLGTRGPCIGAGSWEGEGVGGWLRRRRTRGSKKDGRSLARYKFRHLPQ